MVVVVVRVAMIFHLRQISAPNSHRHHGISRNHHSLLICYPCIFNIFSMSKFSRCLQIKNASYIRQ